MVTVSLDTSALMLPVELDIRVFDELERVLGKVDPLVHQAVVTELERLREEGGVTGRAAAVGLELVDERCEIVGASEPVTDTAVLELALEGSAAYVVTADRGLAERAKAAGIPAIIPRGRRQLVVDHP